MSIKCVIFILTALLCSHTLCEQPTVESKRNGKFFGITGHLSGSSNFHVVPFWKQWNALFQVNVEKNKHKHNNEIYVVPASHFYYPHYDSYGLYVPHMYGGLAGGELVGNRLHGPMSLLLDEYKFPTTTLVPHNPDIDNRQKLGSDANDDGAKKTDKNVGLFNLNIRDDRKTHKRDIVYKTKTDNEVVATVVEITDINIDATTTSAATAEPDINTTTESNESQTTEKMESTTSSKPSSSTSENPTASTVDTGFQPILNIYYGGTPNKNANYIYITTAEPIQELTTSTERPNTINDRNDFGEFKPSIQYEYRNYRFKPDKYFVPVAGIKHVF